MFRTKSRSERASEKAAAKALLLKERAGDLKEKVTPQAHHAALQAKEGAALAAVSAKGWAAPRLEKAKDKSVERTAPKVEHAAEALAPRVDAVHDKIVEDVLPRLVEAFSAAAAAAAMKADAARDVSQAGLSTAGKKAKAARKVAEPKRSKRKVFFLLTLVGAAAAAGFAAWKRSQPTDDPWVTATGTSPSSRLGGSSTPGGLGSGSLAAESTDVDTPKPDGLTDGSAERALEGETPGSADLPGAGVSGEDRPGRGSTAGAPTAPAPGSTTSGKTPTPADLAKSAESGSADNGSDLDNGTGRHRS